MKYLKTIGVIFGGIVVFIALVYFIWAAFIPMMIGGKAVEREVLQQSHQYVDSKRSAVLKLYREYTDASGAHKKGIKMQMCEEAADIKENEVPLEVNNICNR